MDRSVRVTEPVESGDDTVVLPIVDEQRPPPGPGAPLGGWVVLGIAVLVLIQQTWLVIGWFSRFVSDDWALLWAAAESWGRLQPEQPNFWGQAYGSTLESIPTEFLHTLGFGYPVALPIVLTAAHLASWWIPAAAAWRRGHRFLAALAVALPAVLSTEYVVAASVYGTAAGRFFGGIVVAIVILFPDRLRWASAAVAVSALAFLVDTSSLLMTAPACVYTLVRCIPAARERGWRRTAITFLIALTPIGIWLAFVGWWYGQHPTDDMHPTAPFEPHWDVLGDNLTHPERMLGPYTPEVLRNPLLVFLIVGVLGVLVLVQRRLAVLLAFVVLILVTGLVLSLGKTYDDLGTVYFQAARLLLPLPIGLWFIATCLQPLPVSETWQRWTAIGLVVLVGLTATWRVVTWSDRGGMLEADAVGANAAYEQMSADELLAICDQVRQAAAQTGADVAIFADRIPAYGCAALIGPAVTTVFPGYDRRRWVLEALSRPRSTPVVLWVGQVPGMCDTGETCAEVTPGVSTIELAGRSPIQLLHDLIIAVRPF
jgi:hypothetical protein